MFKKLFGQKAKPEVKVTNENQTEQMALLQMNLDNLNDDLLKQNEQMLKAWQTMMA